MELERFRPGSLEEVSELVRQAAARQTPIYPIGGGTALGYGGLPNRPGWGLSLQQLRRVVDYPARDLTITVEAGLPVSELQALLAQQGQRWPVDVPQGAWATVGGVVACNLSGPRRYAYGAVSESVLALTAVDGQAVVFSAGARVVKNAAGYNLCRLLAGSLGTLAVLVQITLMVKPLPETTAFVVGDLDDWDKLDRLLGAMEQSRVFPTAIELLAGPAWQTEPLLGPWTPQAKARLALGLEGSVPEVSWQIAQLESAWQREGVRHLLTLPESDAQKLWQRLIDFPVPPSVPDTLANGFPPASADSWLAEGASATGGFSAAGDLSATGGLSAAGGFEVSEKLARPSVGSANEQGDLVMVVQASVLPSEAAWLARRWLQMDRQVSVLVHLASGCLIGHFPIQGMEPRRWIQEGIFPSITQQRGHGRVLALPDGTCLEADALWTHVPARHPLMQAIKQRFDPQGILSPGRFGFGISPSTR